MQKRGFDVVGPLSGDTVFHYALQGDFDAVVAMYHDQGLAPLKAVAFDSGINWTLGLPFIRTSPDHGTAYDIAGKGIANPGSMIAAIRLAKQLANKQTVGTARCAVRTTAARRPYHQPISSRTFAPISPCFTSDSPTRIAPAPHFFNSLHVRARVNAAFGDQQRTVTPVTGGLQQLRRQLFGRRQIHLESFQIAVVHADERRGNFQRAFQFRLVMNFHQHGQAGLGGERMKFCQLLVRQNGDDEQDGVRAPFDGFENLALINDEILAQQRQFHGGANLAEIIERALEKFLVRQNGQAACARRLVFFGDADGIEILANDAGGRRGFFDFGNQGDALRERDA